MRSMNVNRIWMKRTTAWILALLLLLGLTAPAVRLHVYAEVPNAEANNAKFYFYYQKTDDETEHAVSDVIVTITELAEEPDPENPEDPSEPTEPTDPTEYPVPTDAWDPAEPSKAKAPAVTRSNTPIYVVKEGGQVYQSTSDSNGLASFTGIPDGTYNCHIASPAGYKQIPDTQIEIKLSTASWSDEYRLYAEKPTGQITASTDPVYGNVLTLKMSAEGLGDFSYSWKKGEQTLSSTTNTLYVGFLEPESEGIYTCTVHSNRTDPQDGDLERDYTLTVAKAHPKLNITATPPSNSSYNQDGVTLKASLRHPTSNVPNVRKPTGKVSFYEEETLLGEAELVNGDMEISGVILLSGTHHITAVYTPAEDELCYEGSSAEIDYNVNAITPIRGRDYTVNNVTGSNGWYNSAGALVITPMGFFDRISLENDETLQEKLEIDTETENGSVRFYLVNQETGERSTVATERYKQDHTPPYNLSGEPKAYSNLFYYFYASDDLSGVDKVYCYFKDESRVEAHWSNSKKCFYYQFSNYSFTDTYFWNFSYFTAVDEAGNETIPCYLDSKRLTVEISSATKVVRGGDQEGTEDDVFYHLEEAKPITIKLTTYDSENYASDVHLYLNNQAIELQSDAWTYDEANKLATATLDFSADGSYQFKVVAENYQISCSDSDAEDALEDYNPNTYVTGTHIIDTVAPTMNLVFSNSPAIPEGGQEYQYYAYPAERKACLRVVEQNFDSHHIEVNDFHATDVTGAAVENEDVLKNAMLNQLQNGTWSLETDENGTQYHVSPELCFSTDATYTFTLTCTDIGGNTSSLAQSAFTVDTHAPEELTISYYTNAVSLFLETISLGFYNPEVEIIITAKDVSSGVDHFELHYQTEEGSHSLNDSEINFTILSDALQRDGALVTASFTLTANELRQYRGSLYFIAVDCAGNESDRHYGNGVAKVEEVDGETQEHATKDDFVLVVDTIAPTRTVSYPTPQLIRDRSKNNTVVEADPKTICNEENTDYTLYYDATSPGNIPITIQITEANFDPQDEDLVVELNGQPYEIRWERTDEENNPILWTGVVNLTMDGSYQLNLSYRDHSGNEMEPYSSGLIVLDHVKPMVERYEFNPATSNGETGTDQFIEKLEYGYYFKQDFAVTVYTSDATPSSGLHYVRYRLVSYENGVKTNEETSTALINEGKAYLAIPAGFKGQIFTECFDLAGNKSLEVAPQGLVVDRAPPSIEVRLNQSTPYQDSAGNKLFVANTTVTVTVTDLSSGIKEIGYRQQSERNNLDRSVGTIPNTGAYIGAEYNGWIVKAMDQNLVTIVERTFSYTGDDNDILLIVDAMDRANNRRDEVRSETFTVDLTEPVINVVFDNTAHVNEYYSEKRTATVTVTERNFDAGRIQAEIENAIGPVPQLRFDSPSNTEHIARLEFNTGDYRFQINGTDLGAHQARATYAGGNENRFFVDLTDPVITTNFDSFTNKDREDSFREVKTANIEIKEHNFDPSLVDLQIFRKAAGAEHDENGFENVTQAMLKNLSWSNPQTDLHAISFSFQDDAVYLIMISANDKAGRSDVEYRTVVFEIDETVPVIVERNGVPVKPDDTECCEIYNAARKDDPIPEVKFQDTNIHHIEYELYVWVPNYSDLNNYPTVVSERVFLEQDTAHTGTISGDTFRLDEFQKDGVYTVRLKAYDVAGNVSEENTNTFVRIVDSKILAYIKDSSLEQKTGLFSFQDENGNPISMRSDRFEDLTVVAFIQTGSTVQVVLRDSNADEEIVGELQGVDQTIYGIDVCTTRITGNSFAELYPDDADTNLVLSVKNGEDRMDLGRIHIDNIVPTCEMPEGFRSWKWYVGNASRTFTITNISEDLDWENCAVYDNREKLGDDAVYYSPEDGTISFTLEKGWHNVGVVLCDLAGNTNNIQEKTNIHIGLFWLWVILGGATVVGGVIALVAVRAKRKRTELEE